MAATYTCTLSDELKEKALKELNEKEETRVEDINRLREMVTKNKGIKCPLDDGFFLRFLRARKFDLQRAYDLLQNYYKIRAQNAEHFINLKPSAVTACLEDGVSVVLPKRDKHGRRILYIRPGKWNPSKYSIFDVMRVDVLNLEKAILDEEIQICGFVGIGNMEGLTWEHAKHIEREFFRITSTVMQEAFPARMKGINFVNEPSVFGYLFGIMKLFLSAKMASRVNFHGSSLESLHKEFGKDCLPEELGGTLPHGDKLAQDWKQELLSSEAMFERLEQYKIELPRSISQKALSDSQETSVTGSFKKLSVD